MGLEGDALAIAEDMKRRLTDFRDVGKEDKKEILRVWVKAQNTTVDGRQVGCAEDYCGADTNTAQQRRLKMTSLHFALVLRESILRRLPKKLFSRGYVPLVFSSILQPSSKIAAIFCGQSGTSLMMCVKRRATLLKIFPRI